MNHTDTGTKTSYGAGNGGKAAVSMLSAATITGDDVCNLKDEKLGTIQDIMLDIPSGTIRYAVLSSCVCLGMCDRLFAVPWSALKLDGEHKRFTLDVDVERLKAAPGFNKDEWPNMADSKWSSSIDSYYATRSSQQRS